jgi:EmrB/QacA subfamily drug resistance transporter
VTGFMLTATITSPLYGKFSDIYGRKSTFGVSISIFLVSSVLCGAASSMNELIVFRAVQGLGAGGLYVLAQAMIGDVLTPRERPRYQGLFTGAFGLASVAGPLLGGVITQALNWRWIFYVNLPLGGLAWAMSWAGLRKLGIDRKPGKTKPVDVLGTLLLTALTASLMLMLDWGGIKFAWFSLDTLGMAVLTLVLLALFIAQAARAVDPVIRLGLFRNPVIARGSLVGGMVMFSMMGALVFMPLYFQLVIGMTPSASGAMIIPQAGCMLLTSTLGGRVVSRLGRYRPFLLAGLGIELLSLVVLAGFAYSGASALWFGILMGVFGLGMGMGMPNLVLAMQNAVAHAELGAATGTMIFTRSLGGAVGVAASGAVMAISLLHAHAGADLDLLRTQGASVLRHVNPEAFAAISQAYQSALTGSFMMCSAVMLMAFVVVLGLPDKQLRNQFEMDPDETGTPAQAAH